MIGLLLENEADCLIRQHTEPRGGPPKNRTRWPEPLPRERFRSSAMNRQSQGVAKRQVIGSLRSFDVDQTYERNTRGADSFYPLTV